MRLNEAKLSDDVCIKGYASLTFQIVNIAERKKRPVTLQHPMTGGTMDFDWRELEPLRR